MPFLPEYSHMLIVTEKRQPTPRLYPRRAGTPAKNPLGNE